MATHLPKIVYLVILNNLFIKDREKDKSNERMKYFVKLSHIFGAIVIKR